MRLVYESKYNVGDSVFQVMRYINGTHIIERQVVRVIGIVSGKEGGMVKYELTPITPYSQYHKECIESALYPTREDAQAVADAKAAEYIKKTRERLEEELRALDTSKSSRIAEAIADIEEDIEIERDHIKRQLEKLKEV